MDLTDALEKEINELQADLDRRRREYAEIPQLEAKITAFTAALQAARGSLVAKQPTLLLPSSSVPLVPPDKISPALRKAWAKAEEKRIEERVNRDAAIEAGWHSFCANKPDNMEQAFLELVKANPYKTISGEILFQAAWMAWEARKEDFVEVLSVAFGCTEQALRQKVRSIWQHLNPRIWLMMPFMVKATIAPQKYANLLEEARKKLGALDEGKPPVLAIVHPNKEATG